jgi:hypothetical protein
MFKPDILDEILAEMQPEDIKSVYAKKAEIVDYEGKTKIVTGKELTKFMNNPAEFGVSANLYFNMTIMKSHILKEVALLYSNAGLIFPPLR